jgi:hypothetical protein
MLKGVQGDRQRGLLRANRLVGYRIRSLQDDKEIRELVAGSLIVVIIRFLPSVGLTRIEGVQWLINLELKLVE